MDVYPESSFEISAHSHPVKKKKVGSITNLVKKRKYQTILQNMVLFSFI